MFILLHFILKPTGSLERVQASLRADTLDSSSSINKRGPEEEEVRFIVFY
jgi:hypothetical protein